MTAPIPRSVARALSMLRENGFEAYMIGGCVRDRLLGDIPKDYDITTSALPEETKNVFGKFRVIETGIKHGTVTVLIDDMPLEITTYRIDSEYSDNRRPDSVTFTKNLEEDTARRDFTMNAIAIDENENIVDFHGGVNDIKNKLIRCVGDPDLRFSEDALRILRAVRFSSVLGFEIEENTRAAIFRNKELLLNISSERIASELVKLLCGSDVRRVFTQYIDVLSAVIPELADMKDFDQHNHHHRYTVSEHTARVIENIQPEPILRLAALLHDVAKPMTYIMRGGEGHFYGHAAKGAQVADAILSRLKFDNETHETVTALIKYHDRQIEPTEVSVKRFLRRFSFDFLLKLLELKRADDMSKGTPCGERFYALDTIRQIADGIINRGECFTVKQLAVGGRDLIDIGFVPGPALGECLSGLLDEVIAGNLQNEREALIGYVRTNYKLPQ